MKVNVPSSVNINNNTNYSIPIDLIKYGYFTNITILNGRKLSIDLPTSKELEDNKNYIGVRKCNKAQSDVSRLALKLINEKELITTNSREVIVE